MAGDIPVYRLTERRIGHLTLAIGAIAAVSAAYFSTLRIGTGILVGALLAWIGFRWLESALDGLVRASTADSGSAQSSVPLGSIAKFVGRYALIGVVVCVIFFSFHVPIVSMLLGLCALGAATILATLYEILHPAN